MNKTYCDQCERIMEESFVNGKVKNLSDSMKTQRGRLSLDVEWSVRVCGILDADLDLCKSCLLVLFREMVTIMESEVKAESRESK